MPLNGQESGRCGVITIEDKSYIDRNKLKRNGEKMNRRAEEIKKRIAERKKRQGVKPGSQPFSSYSILSDEERYGAEHLPVMEYSHSPYERDSSPVRFFQKEWLVFKFLTSVCLVLVVGILFKNSSPGLDQARHYVQKTMETEFQFASVSKWYEETLGQPLALLPMETKKETAPSPLSQYAVPASGRVLETFEKNGQGIMIETGSQSSVEAMSEGIVTFAGKKEDSGKTVIIQHADGSETWYGQLENIDVNLYDFVDKGKTVGKVLKNQDGKTGTFYFAIKKGEQFIDPNQVISFE
jgi:stage IV sporulation protein FA